MMWARLYIGVSTRQTESRVLRQHVSPSPSCPVAGKPQENTQDMPGPHTHTHTHNVNFFYGPYCT